MGLALAKTEKTLKRCERKCRESISIMILKDADANAMSKYNIISVNESEEII